MKLSITKPIFDNHLLEAVQIADRKGVTIDIVSDGDLDKAYAHCNGRTVGKLFLRREKTQAKIVKTHVIEREFYPYEAILFELVNFYKGSKTKSIVE